MDSNHFTCVIKTNQQWNTLSSLLNRRWYSFSKELKSSNVPYSEPTRGSPSRQFLDQWKNDSSATISKLIELLKNIQHDDAITQIQAWINEQSASVHSPLSGSSTQIEHAAISADRNDTEPSEEKPAPQPKKEECIDTKQKLPGEEEYEESWNLFFNFRHEEALDLLHKTEHYQYPPTFLLLSYYYAYGWHGCKDMYLSRKYANQAAKHESWFVSQAKTGNPAAQCNAAFFFSEGPDKNKNRKQVGYWYRKSAKQGFIRAEYFLAVYEMHTNHQSKEAGKWMFSAASKGCFMSQMDLDPDQYPEKDLILGWWRKACDAGNTVAMKNLAEYLCKGEPNKQDKREAMHWYQTAANLGDPSSQVQLAVCFQKGEICRRNYKKMLHWLQKACDQGYYSALHSMGVSYELGLGVPIDKPEALEWYQKAAEKNYPQSQYLLGVALYEGTEIEKDYVKSVYWLKKAANHDYKHAQEFLNHHPELMKKYNTWKVARFLWIGHLKEDASYCILAQLPKDMISEISKQVNVQRKQKSRQQKQKRR